MNLFFFPKGGLGCSLCRWHAAFVESASEAACHPAFPQIQQREVGIISLSLKTRTHDPRTHILCILSHFPWWEDRQYFHCTRRALLFSGSFSEWFHTIHHDIWIKSASERPDGAMQSWSYFLGFFFFFFLFFLYLQRCFWCQEPEKCTMLC